MINLSKSFEYFNPAKFRQRIHIIGCGATGSALAENLVRLGLTDLVLYDFDTVDEHNIANQMYRTIDIGKPKTEALKEQLVAINPDLENTIKIRGKWDKQQIGGAVFLCVDSIESRREIATFYQYNQSISAMFDFRLGLTSAQHFSADWRQGLEVQNFINSMNFTDEEAKEYVPVSGCNLTLSVVPTPRTIVALGVANFMNWVNGQKLKRFMEIDAFSFSLVAY